MDLVSFGSALASIKTASDIAKLIKDSGATLEQAEVKLKLADLIGSLADARIQLAEIKEALSDKEREITSLRDELSKKQSIVWSAPFYWVENGEERDGPFCQKCHDVDAKLVRMHNFDTGRWICQACKTVRNDAGYVSRPVQQPVRRSSWSRDW